MYDFAKKIGGDKVEVINLVPAGTEPHDWEPSDEGSDRDGEIRHLYLQWSRHGTMGR